MGAGRPLLFGCFLCALCAAGCSNSEAELNKQKLDLAKVQAQLDVVTKQLDAAAKDAKAPPKWEYKVVERFISQDALAALGNEGWEWLPLPFAPPIVYPTNIDPKSGNVAVTRIDSLTGQKVDMHAPTNSVMWFKRRKG